MTFRFPILTVPILRHIAGGEKTEYQGRKKRCTTNALFLTDNQGIPLAMAEPKAGNHAGLFEIEDRLDEIVCQLSAAAIAVESLL